MRRIWEDFNLAFKSDEVGLLLVRCHRRCCICHRYCGVKIETDHIVPIEQGGTDDIENAIPVCFECHAEIHSYNNTHPRGRKFRPEELTGHKEQWLSICRERPEALLQRTADPSVGPIQALVDELDFNCHVAEYGAYNQAGCPFNTKQFERAINDGVISMLEPNLKREILEAYRQMNRTNSVILTACNSPIHNRVGPDSNRAVAVAVGSAQKAVKSAYDMLVSFLTSEE